MNGRYRDAVSTRSVSRTSVRVMIVSMALEEALPTPTAAEAVAVLFRAQYLPLVRLASLLLGDRGAGEEVVQEAFVKLQLGWGRVRDPERAPAWLRSTVLNGARSRLRRRRVRSSLRSLPAPATSSAAPAETAVLAVEAHQRMITALRHLPLRQREALVLRFYLDLSEAETAAAMGLSAGSVKTHVHRGLAALRTELGEEDR